MDDNELVRRVLGGDDASFSLIVRRHSPAVFSTTLGLLRDRAWAEELTQRTFVRAFERLGSFRHENLRQWLRAIAYHLCLNELASERRRRTVKGERLEETVADEPYSEERERMIGLVERALEDLPEKERDVIKMHYYERLSTKEIAQRLGTTQANVLVRLSRIREKLRKSLRYERD
ncbi:MAG: RNA polymerase sigma factor [Prevotellaceae bacterium]|nr:RNA polymerase sigma factor [Prevotellaceae bacterium]MCD8303660.1 RNA polymerase sigma factor [Prevotellaceae bacterium]